MRSLVRVPKYEPLSNFPLQSQSYILQVQGTRTNINPYQSSEHLANVRNRILTELKSAKHVQPMINQLVQATYL